MRFRLVFLSAGRRYRAATSKTGRPPALAQNVKPTPSSPESPRTRP